MSDSLSTRTVGGDAASGPPVSAKVRHRPSWIAFVVLGAIFCLGMGLWQLDRYQEATGTVQNLGYTFMWPFLAGFLVYAYLRYVRLEADEADTAVSEAGAGAAGHADGEGDDDEVGARPGGTPPRRGARRRERAVTEIPADLLPARRPVAEEPTRDEGLEAYNSYLAELARQDAAAGDRHEERTDT
ncbi:hypothetical protein CEY15_14155 [Dietzia natronolimnaea]|uniref:Uncharacterized protein n=1 Tax=Dietzia natronolimnaea TaxID=161920 RepID=A0A2A2WMD1_9ACTN|nr:hypothetical protein [Dietzia natronolimnaea]PAY22376.1 hypothetical protein CEY15_14155 [Dietzia natronolimnaea]